MKMLEYQSKKLLARYGVPVPESVLCHNVDEVGSALRQVGGDVALKAQVPAGRRGKEGGIWLGGDEEEAVAVATRLLGRQVRGYKVKEILVEEKVDATRELYLSVLTDTAAAWSCPMFMLSSEGGMDIEEVAAAMPQSIHTLHVDPCYGLLPFQARELARYSGLGQDLEGALVRVMEALYQAYVENDAELVEVNPLAVTAGGGLVALDAKVTIDNSARYRHPDLEGADFDSVESYAASLGLSYVELDGNIGLISNGAGLTMATMDHLALLGGRPANFLDTGERILRGGIPDSLGILLANPRVNVILINIFGGGVRCDIIAEKLIEAVGALPEFRPPIVVSLNGRNDDLGRSMLIEAGLSGVEVLPTIDEAVTQAARLGTKR